MKCGIEFEVWLASQFNTNGKSATGIAFFTRSVKATFF
jgi:hypothetical protein